MELPALSEDNVDAAVGADADEQAEEDDADNSHIDRKVDIKSIEEESKDDGVEPDVVDANVIRPRSMVCFYRSVLRGERLWKRPKEDQCKRLGFPGLAGGAGNSEPCDQLLPGTAWPRGPGESVGEVWREDEGHRAAAQDTGILDRPATAPDVEEQSEILREGERNRTEASPTAAVPGLRWYQRHPEQEGNSTR